jgi:hypothetical protein
MKRGTALVQGIAVVAILGSEARVSAYDTGSRSTGLFPPGYMGCREERVRATAPEVRAPVGEMEVLVPVPIRRRPPAPVVLGEDLADEVTMVEPVPSGRGNEREAAQNDVGGAVVVESANDFRCLGLVRGRVGIVRTIGAPPGTRFYGHPYDAGWRIDNMVAASVFDLVEAKGALRAVLTRPVGEMGSFERTELRTSAAVALAELGDRESVPALVAWVRALESRTLGFQYRSAWHALERLDGAEAETYAVGMLLRAADGELGNRVNADLLRSVATITPRSGVTVLPLLRRLTAPDSKVVFDGSSSRCVLTAVRLRLGDAELMPLAREQISGSLTDNLAANCYSHWLPVTVGNDPADVEAMLHRRAYEPMLRFVQHVQARRAMSGGAGADWERGASRLLEGLTKGLEEPALGDRSRNDYYPTHRAMHLAAMAGLGSSVARDLLFAMVEDAKDETDGGWVAGYWALRLGLRGADARVLRRLQLGMKTSTRQGRLDFTVGVPTTWRTRVLEELVRVLPVDDARWTIALLDKESPTREKAVFLLSRRKPEGACQTVLEAARGASEETVKQAFWALSVLGAACWTPMSSAAGDPMLPASVRGPAIVLLAMTRSPQARARMEAVAGLPEYRLYARTADIILRSPE